MSSVAAIHGEGDSRVGCEERFINGIGIGIVLNVKEMVAIVGVHSHDLRPVDL